MKKIGIVGWKIGGAFGVGISYMRFIESLDAEVIILSPVSSIRDDLSLLILPGGPDVNPTRYGGIPDWNTSAQDPIREHFDVYHLPEYVKNMTPVFGVCRGLQSICVHFGSSMYPDMYHETNTDEDPYKAVHELNISGNEKLVVKVNSRHHQSIHLSDSKVIKVLATHRKIKSHIEAIAIEGYPIRAVQFHPEDLDEWSGVKYARDLIKQIIK